MQKHVLVLTTSAFTLAALVGADAQQQVQKAARRRDVETRGHLFMRVQCALDAAGKAVGFAGDPMMQQQPQVLQQRQELERQQDRAQSPRRRVEEGRDQDDDERYGGRMTGGGWRYQQDWQRRGAMNPGMMGQGWMMGSGNVGPGPSVMMRMIFTLMDSDGDGTVSLQEFQAAHERIFKGMDANKDGRLTLEEILAFMQGTRRSVP